jgi:hypothetical protein
MRRILWITVAVAALALGAATTASAGQVTTCVTSLNGFGQADVNALNNQGVNGGTITGTFGLPPGLSDKVVDSGDGYLGACAGGGGAGLVGAANAIWLCYSKFQVDPGYWFQPQAGELFAAGYWQPYAVKANIGSTVLGAYHIVCNLPAGYTLTSPPLYVDEGGLVVDATKAGIGLANGGYAQIANSA